MPRIVFNSVEFQNFQSFGNSKTKVQIDADQISLICGTNGSGKTCFIQTISYALFGKSLTGITKGDLVNNKNKKNLLVSLEFTIGTDQYLIRRGEKPSVLQLFKNNVEVNMDGDSRIFQKRFEEEILKFNFKAFKQLICLGSEFTRFFKMTAAERRVFIESILDLQVISNMNVKVKEEIKTLKSAIESRGSELSLKSSTLKIYEDEQLRENEDLTARKTTLLDERDKLESELKAINIENDKFAIELADLDSKHDNTRKFINATTEKMTKLRSQAEVGKQKKSDIQKEIDFFAHHEECPTCKQVIDKEFISRKTAELNKTLSKIDSKLEEINSIFTGFNDELSNYKAAEQSILEAKNKLVSEMSVKRGLAKEKKNRIDAINMEVAKIENTKPGGNRADAINKLKLEIEDLTSVINKFGKRMSIYNHATDVLSDSGVKQAIISNYIDYINQQLGKYLEMFNFNFSVEFDSEFNDTILMDFRDSVQYESLSEGQKARLEFCILMVWRDIAKTRNSISTNLLSIDELFDSALDDSGMQDMIDVLKNEDGNIFIISHKNVKSMFDHIYEVIKEKYGFSEMVEL